MSSNKRKNSDNGEDDPSCSKQQRMSSETNNSDMSTDNDDNDDDGEDLFASSSPNKSSSTTSNYKQNATNTRRAGLSKFVRRILDPNREPRGLVEPPQVIPLNDEFLQAFGKREKAFDEQVGRETDFDQTIMDDHDDNDDGQTKSDDNNDNDENNNNDGGPTKVKITNLLYTTSAETLGEECKNFGDVVELNMILDDSDPEGKKNVGRAYVVFANAEAAQNCVDQQLGGSLDGRPVRVTLAEDASSKKSSTLNPTAGAARYYQNDISTKCFRCGKIGHMEANCPNPPKANICPLCAKADEHDIRACPLNRVCFNCGVPGHINRECRVPRGQPPRQICTLCCGSGHDRFSCQRSVTNIPGILTAICSVCHQRGHFMCQDMKWFFGLEGVFCFNCGGKGHVGHQCQRPNLDDLARNDGWAMKEVEKADEYKLADEMEAQRAERARQDRERQRERELQRERNRDLHRDRARNRGKSAPPPRNRGYQDNNNNGGGRGGDEFRFTVGGGNDNVNTNNRRGGRGGGGGGRGRRGY